jgi:quinol monooxygenase YgiN
LPTVVIIAPIRTLKGKGQEFEKLFMEFREYVQKEEKYTLSYALYRREDDPDRFEIYEKYTNKEALEKHISSTRFKEFGKLIAPLLVGPLTPEKVKYLLEVT